jgi:hypothetical protein
MNLKVERKVAIGFTELRTLRRVFVVLLGMAIFDIGCSKEQTASPLPEELHGLKLMNQFSGQEAAARIARLHGKDVAPEESYIGHYGTGPGHAMLYVSGFEFEEQANALLAAMSLRIGDGSSGFGHHKQFEVDGREIHMVLGQGQVHYFFARGRYVYWLGVAPGMAQIALAELLDVATEKVPTLEGILSEL